jgi:hypothetical protein
MLYSTVHRWNCAMRVTLHFSLAFTWRHCVVLVCIMAVVAVVAKADTHYVSLAGTSASPYTNWAEAANSIQAAVNVAGDGDEVVVADGDYILSEQIVIAKGITVRSDLGRSMCRIDGDNVCRCIWLAHSNAVVSGFTITRGLAGQGGQSDGGGGIYVDRAGTVRDCSIADNICSNIYGVMCGGGIYLSGGGTIQNCLVSGNIADSSVASEGGGIYMSGGLVENCLVIGNINRPTGSGWGGGIYLETGIANHCTIVNNSGVYSGGGVYLKSGVVVNSIVLYNQATGYQECRIVGGGSVSFTCCTWYDGMSYDAGNVYNKDPLFVDYTNGDFHLQEGSPCIDAGATTDVVTVDYEYATRPLDGNVDGNFRVDMGAFEYRVTDLRCSVAVNTNQGFDPLPVRCECFTGGTNLDGLYYRWDFDNDGHIDLAGPDLAVVTNTYTNWGWKTITVMVSNVAGEAASAALTNAVKVGHPLVYVSPSGSSVFPYTNWTMAATNLNSIDDLLVDGTEVVVTNGHYDLSQEFSLNFAVTLRSVNGWRQTTLDGNDITRCVRLAHSGAVVDGFTLTRGSALSGGGAYLNGGTVRNCWIHGNRARNGGISGGGGVCMYGGRLANSLITGNSAASSPVNEANTRGGGVWLNNGGIVEFCTIMANSISSGRGGGGLYGGGSASSGGTLYNCIIWGNTAPTGANIGQWNNCIGAYYTCSTLTGYMASMEGNITNNPCLSADWHLLAGSPCINAGTNLSTAPMDMEGISRDLAGNPDMGSFEYNGTTYPPMITDHPLSQAKNPGSTATFSVAVVGIAPLYYQWQKNGVNIASANSTNYMINPVMDWSAGGYRCLVSNAAGVVESAVAVLNVNAPVAIATQPQSRANNPGSSASFTVAATGTAPLCYQWQKNGANIELASNTIYMIDSVAAGDAGAYLCLVSNVVGVVASAVAVLSVNAPVAIATQPQSRANNPGSSATFTVAATGTAPLYYQWQKNGTNIESASNTIYTIDPVTLGDVGTYRCLISNVVGVVESDAALLGVNNPVAITTQPESQTINPGASASFTVVATGTAPLCYQWQKNGVNIGSANSATYMIASVTDGDAGEYRCIVSNMAGSATSAVAVLTVQKALPPLAPTGVFASDGEYTDKVRVTWNAVGEATGYQVWRSASNNIAIASNLATTATTTYDDLNAATMPGTVFYYWVRAVNAAGAGGFSTNDPGYVRPAIGPTIKANGTVGDVAVNYPDAMEITIEINEINNEGAPADWWVLSLAGSSWYYLNNAVEWTPFDGDLSNCHPLYQGGLFNLPSTLLPVLNIPGLPVSSYSFWFAVDAQMDGILNVDGQILVDSVNVTMLSTLPAPRIKANGATGIVNVNYPDTVSIAVDLTARAYAGVPVDWWVLLCAGSSWFYMDGTVGWTQAGVLRPVYQGALGNLPAVEVLNVPGLGIGSYTFYFAVDLPMNGILDLEQVWVDSVTVNVR